MFSSTEREASASFNDLSQRVKTASVLIVLLIAVLVAARYTCWGKGVIFALTVLVQCFSAYEFLRFSTKGIELLTKGVPLFVLNVLPSIYAVLHVVRHGLCVEVESRFFSVWINHFLFSSFVSLLLMLAYIFIATKKDTDKSPTASSSVMLAAALPLFLVVVLGGASLILVSLLPNSSGILAWIILCASINDSGAYFTGKTIGGPKLAPNISPNKTWSGSVGGLMFGAAVGGVLSSLTGLPISWSSAFLCALFVCFVAQIFDLCKSFLKRLYSVKDSGNIFPGHGGMLDRADGVLGASFGFLLILLWIGHN
jgi:CDP-diglyceride synthetase